MWSNPTEIQKINRSDSMNNHLVFDPKELMMMAPLPALPETETAPPPTELTQEQIIEMNEMPLYQTRFYSATTTYPPPEI